jgi:hypothetical protein
MKDGSLMQLENELADLVDTMNEDGLTPELEEKFEALLGDIKDKVDRIGHYFIMREQEIDGLRRIISMYSDKKRQLEFRLTNFKKYLSDLVRTHGENGKGGKRIKGQVVTIKDISKHKRIYDIDLIPPEFIENDITLRLNTTQLAELTGFMSIKGWADAVIKKDPHVIEEAIDAQLSNDIKIQGVGEVFIKNASLLGLKKLKDE